MSSLRFAAMIPSIICVIVALTAASWLIVLIAFGQPLQAHWLFQVLLASSAIITSLVVEQHRHKQWTKPFQQLHELLPQVHQGQAAIEELSRVGGSLLPIIPLIQDVLRDLKQQKAELAELNEEVRLKVARRTDALERQVGNLRQQATRDALTGLCNRRMLDQHLPQLLEQCREQNSELAVLMTDVDYFKKMNDTLGHAAGDELLRAIGQLTRSTIGESDMAFRSGGDEFVILLVGYDTQSAMEVARRLISLTDGYARTLRVEPRPRLSVGLCLLSQYPGASADMLLQAADKALYDMKDARKQATIAPTATRRLSA